MAVEVELRAERTARRDAQEAKSEHLVDEVEVVVNALAAVAAQVRHAGSLVVPRPIRRTELHHREDVRVTTSLGDDLPDAVFLPISLRLLDVLDLQPFLGSEAVNVRTNRLPERVSEERTVVEHPDVASVEQRRDRSCVADARDRPLDHDPVEA